MPVPEACPCPVAATGRPGSMRAAPARRRGREGELEGDESEDARSTPGDHVFDPRRDEQGERVGSAGERETDPRVHRSVRLQPEQGDRRGRAEEHERGAHGCERGGPLLATSRGTHCGRRCQSDRHEDPRERNRPGRLAPARRERSALGDQRVPGARAHQGQPREQDQHQDAARSPARLRSHRARRGGMHPLTDRHRSRRLPVPERLLGLTPYGR